MQADRRTLEYYSHNLQTKTVNLEHDKVYSNQYIIGLYFGFLVWFGAI